MRRCCDPRIWLCLLVPFLVAFAPHDGADSGKSIGSSAPPGIGGDGPWQSRNMILLGRLPLADIGANASNIMGSDCWGWTDSQTGREYAICCLTNATSFIDITDPADPRYLGKLMTQTGNSAWRDVKVYSDHAFIVSDGNGNHGMQVFDLTQLRTADPNNPGTFANTTWYDDGTASAHNIAINEDSGFAYIVGSDHPDAAAGLQVVDISDPANPVPAGEFAADGYTHDCQVVNYQGPDSDYAGQEIAFCCNEDTVTIVNVTNKNNMSQISRNPYAQDGYTHQGWLSDDHRYFYMGDELDERQRGGPTRTHVFDCLDLDNPDYKGFYSGETAAIDHNLYVRGNLLFCGNYSSGLRVLEMDATDPSRLDEVAFFDTYNTNTGVNFDGVWSIYPYYDSDTILVHDRQNGMFLVRLSPISIELPNGHPDLVDPSGVVEFDVLVEDFAGTAMPGSGVLHIDTGSGFQPFPMSEVEPGRYEAKFPMIDCGTEVRYFVSAQGTDGTEMCVPSTAPVEFFQAFSAYSVETTFVEDFETDSGWSVSGEVVDGAWTRGVPVGGGDRGDPPSDADGSGSCYLTDNEDGNSDVDDGSTVLISPPLDASAPVHQEALISYYRWYSNDGGGNPASDIFVVDISNDAGETWTNLETVGPAGNEISGGWFQKTFRVSDFVSPTSQVMLRFTASDLGGGSVVEAAVDGIEIKMAGCAVPVVFTGQKLRDGIIAGGGELAMNASDDLYLELEPSPTSNPFKQRIDSLLVNESPIQNPTGLSLRVEAAMAGGPAGDVTQRVEIFDYRNRRWEVLDTRSVSNTEQVLEFPATGDVSRFVKNGSREVLARVIWSSHDFSGSPFFWSVDVDQIILLVSH